jgi:hypothetical protein
VSQQQCPWCGRCGPHVEDAQLHASYADPHADGSSCVCRHVTCATRRAAFFDGGRYWDGTAWRCFWCSPASRDDAAVEEERRLAGADDEDEDEVG